MSNALPQTYVWLRPPPSVREALDAHRRQWWWPRGCAQPRQHRLHMTVHALGVLGDAQIDAAIAALRAVRLPAFELALCWSGVWAGNGVAVACPRPDPALAQFHAASARAMGRAGRTAGWAPHVTLARNAWRAGAALLPPLRWPVHEFLLVRSWLPPHPVRHEELARYALQGACRLSEPWPEPPAAARSSPCPRPWANLHP